MPSLSPGQIIAWHNRMGTMLWSGLSPKPAPSLPAPEETVIGYQEAWRWWQGTTQLRSTNVSTGWNWSSENVAEFAYSTGFGSRGFASGGYGEDEPEEVKDPSKLHEWASGGFYAYKPTSVEHPAAVSDSAVSFFGRVALYGTVVEHSRGYRAEKSRVLDVWCRSREIYNLSAHHPQVKGIFDIGPSVILDANGRRMEDREWLTLVNLKEYDGLSQSNFLLHNPNPTMITWTETADYPRSSNLIAIPSPVTPEPLYKGITRAGDICEWCQQGIRRHEAMSIRREFIEGPNCTYTEKDVKGHLACAAQYSASTLWWHDALGDLAETLATLYSPGVFSNAI